MGISGLLQFIKDAAEPVNVKKYKGQTVAVDTYCWLHKGAFSCAEKLAKGEPTDQYVWYCMKFVDMLLNVGVKPILVFDGRNLPSKKEVEKTRRERREANLQRGRQLLRDGKLSEARDCFTRCINITPSMAHSLIKVARTRGVDCVVAPYEADAQLAFLTKSGLAHAVITEDSDLLAFGCRKVILKMDKQGNGLEIDQSNLGRCRSLGNLFTQEKFRYMCILSGCDYLASLHGIGLGKACKLLRLAKDPDILKVIRKMGQYLKMNLQVPDSYVHGFVHANNTFLYQLVFDPVQRKVVPLNPYPEHVDPSTLAYAGLNLGDDKGLQMALGNLDINTLERIDDFSPDAPAAQSCKPRSHSWNHSPSSSGRSIWSRDFTAAPSAPAPDPHKSSPTRGQQRVASSRLPCRELQVKRPREDSSVSDQDVLQLYSSSSPSSSSSSFSHKRSRSEPDVDQPSGSSQLRPRNRFATLLQRRNQETEEDHQATRSRFFSSSSSPSQRSQSTTEDQPPAQITEEKFSSSEEPDAPSVEMPSPPSPASSSQGLGLFHWSSPATPGPGPGPVSLKHFQYKKETFSSPKPSGASEDPSSPADELPSSPSSQDSAYFSQSQPPPPLAHGDSLQEDNMDSEAELSLAQRKPGSLGSKVSGLSKPKSSWSSPADRGQKLGPARASGLRKRRSTSNNENSPGVQATISSLWRNFSFKRDAQKMSPCKKAKPMSPARDNAAVSVPQLS
ncbi:unnamed protein product [Ophioblennius macclurei]